MLSLIYNGLISFDITLVFQLLNTVLILFIFIGVPVILFKYIKRAKMNGQKIDDVNNKMDYIMDKFDDDNF